MRSLLKVLLFAQRGTVCAPFRLSPVPVLSAFSWLRQFRLCSLLAPFSRDVGLLQIVVCVIDEPLREWYQLSAGGILPVAAAFEATAVPASALLRGVDKQGFARLNGIVELLKPLPHVG